jgi:hypothetical protein
MQDSSLLMHKDLPRIGGLTWKEIVDAIQTRTTVEVWPVAGPALGYRSKSAAYDAAAKGLIRVIEQGRKKPVPTSWLRQVLGLKKRRRQRLRKAQGKACTIRTHDSRNGGEDG